MKEIDLYATRDATDRATLRKRAAAFERMAKDEEEQEHGSKDRATGYRRVAKFDRKMAREAEK